MKIGVDKDLKSGRIHIRKAKVGTLAHDRTANMIIFLTAAPTLNSVPYARTGQTVRAIRVPRSRFLFERRGHEQLFKYVARSTLATEAS